MAEVVNSAWKREIFDGALSPFQPGPQTSASVCHQLKLNWSPGLLLDNRGSVSDGTGAYQIADSNFHHVAPTQFAIDRQIEDCPISEAMMLVKKETYRPHVSRSERALRTNDLAGIPRASFMYARV
jgi:hypothetical protein